MTITQLPFLPIGSWLTQQQASEMAQRMSEHLNQEWIWCRDIKRDRFRIVRVR